MQNINTIKWFILFVLIINMEVISWLLTKYLCSETPGLLWERRLSWSCWLGQSVSERRFPLLHRVRELRIAVLKHSSVVGETREILEYSRPDSWTCSIAGRVNDFWHNAPLRKMHGTSEPWTYRAIKIYSEPVTAERWQFDSATVLSN